MNNNTNISLSNSSFSLRSKLALFLAFISVIAYANTLKNGFVLDDNVAIVHNNLVTKGVEGIPDILSTPYHFGSEIEIRSNLYRPLPLMVFAIEYQFFGPSPFIGHLVNVLLFAASVILLFWFLDQLFNQQKTGVAFLACLFFSLHPIHTEVVANIKSSDELLCFFFGFLSLNLFMRYAQNGKIYTLFIPAFCLFLSLLSKETAITLIGVIPLVFFFYRNENKKRSLFITLSSVAVAVIYFTIRASVLNNHDVVGNGISVLDNQLVNAPSLVSRLATAVLVLGNYARLLFVPFPLYYDYSYNAIPFAQPGDASVIISLAVYLVFIFTGIYRLLKYPKDPFAFGILFFLVTIFLFSNIFFLIGTIMAERFLFFPSVGFCIVIAFAIQRLPGNRTNTSSLLKKTNIWILAIPVLLLFLWLTINRNTDWRDNYTLYQADSKKSSNSWRIYYNLGTEQCKNIFNKHVNINAEKPLIEEGIQNFERSISILPEFDVAQEHLGTAFLALMRFDSGEIHLKHALKINPHNAGALKRLTGMYFYNHQFRKALEIYQYELAADPGLQVLGYMGVCYLNLEKYDSAITTFRKALMKEPPNMSVFKGMADTYTKLGNTDSATKYEAIVKQNSRNFN